MVRRDGIGSAPAHAVALKRFNQLDTYVWKRLVHLRVERKGRHLQPGEAKRWTSESFHDLGLHRLRGTVRYPEAA